MEQPRQFFRQRAALAALVVVASIAGRCATAAPPPQTVEGLAQMLGRSVGGVVGTSDIAWEPSPGFLTETFFGRSVLFLAAPQTSAPRDLYRARVRVTRDGKPIAVEQFRNLTGTPFGDDSSLEIHGNRAFFATVAYGRIQGLSVLEVDGGRSEDEPASWLDRILASITSFQVSGSFAGLGRTDLVFEVPVQEAKLTFEFPKLAIDIEGADRSLIFDVERRVLQARDGGQAYGARGVVHRYSHKPAILWAVDTVRAEVGPGPIAWLEDIVFGSRDWVKRNLYALSAKSESSTLKAAPSDVQALEPSNSEDDADRMDELAETWPPPALPSLWQKSEPGEGEWQPITDPWLKHSFTVEGTQAPPYFYQTFIRPDPQRPYSHLLLIAMDMRQLELGMEAGFEDPKPLTGPPGTGRLPKDADLVSRIVGTFNGAFKTDHGKYGMMVDRRVLLPPVPGGASIVLTDSGKVGMGSWPRGEDIPGDIASFRQNLDPLVEDGVVNPTGRYVWGWQITGTSVMTQRTALCVTPAGHLYYAFADEIDAPTLSKGMRQAGCAYAMHLDMNPKHCGFVYTDVIDLAAKQFHLRIADPHMQINSDKYVGWSAKDFFFVAVRDPRPPEKKSANAGALVSAPRASEKRKADWKPDPGTQPPPSFRPGVFSVTVQAGGLPVEVVAFDSERVDWTVRAGTGEPTLPDAPPLLLELDGPEKSAAVAAVGLGHTVSRVGAGLSFGADVSLPLRANYATLVMRPGEPLKVAAPGESLSLTAGDEAVQLPVLAEAGELTHLGQQAGDQRQRGALCVTPEGWVMTARARHDSSAPLAKVLVDLGCSRVVELDRGSHHPAFLHRTGTATPPTGGYETTVLYAVGRPMLPRAFRWKPKGSAPSQKPSGHDIPMPKPKKPIRRQRP